MKLSRFFRLSKYDRSGFAVLLGIVGLAAIANAADRAIPDDEREARKYEQAVYLGEEPTFEKVASFYPPIKYRNRSGRAGTGPFFGRLASCCSEDAGRKHGPVPVFADP